MDSVIDARRLRSVDLMILHNAGTASSLLFTTCSQQISIPAGADEVQLPQNAKFFLLPFLSFSSPLVGDYNRFHIEKAINVHSCSLDWLPFNSGVNNFLGRRSALEDQLLRPKAFKLRANLRNLEHTY
jgi:hypothetical protein